MLGAHVPDSAVPSGAERRTVVVLQTHYVDRALIRFFRELAATGMTQYEAVLLMHAPAGTRKPRRIATMPHHFVTTPEIRSPAYTNKSAIGSEWHIWRGGHTDLSALHFFRKNPDFDFYWFVEYDVRFSGDWAEFFAVFEGDSTDLLTTSLRRATVDETWMHWPTLRPSCTAAPLGSADRICGFMPIFRVSRRGMEVMDRAYREGWTGHCEATWPTIINHAGLRIQDIGGDGEFVAPGNRNRFYTNTLSSRDLSPGSLAFRPARFRPGPQRNRLWHPVKPLFIKMREDARQAVPEWIKRIHRRHRTAQASPAEGDQMPARYAASSPDFGTCRPASLAMKH
jgi:hypothetical protein